MKMKRCKDCRYFWDDFDKGDSDFPGIFGDCCESPPEIYEQGDWDYPEVDGDRVACYLFRNKPFFLRLFAKKH